MFHVRNVFRLLALLARERRKIITRLQEKQENLVVAMKRDLQNEIKQGVLSYKVIIVDWKNKYKNKLLLLRFF